MCLCVCFFFFFQAEDGIRDWSVTGVQTCALPILPPPANAVGRATRTTAFAGGGSIAPSADHVELSGAVQWASPGGVLGATADYQQNGPGVGFVPRQYSVGLRVDAVPLPGYGAALLDAGVQRYDWFGARPGATVVRLGLRAPVPGTLVRSEEHTSELQSLTNLVCRLLLEKKKNAVPQ